MSSALLLLLTLLPAPSAANDSGADKGVGTSTRSPTYRSFWGDDRLVDPVPEHGQSARGLYFNGPVLRRLGARGVIKTVKSANMNSVVIDLKDGQGRVMWDTQIPDLQKQKRLFVSDLPALIAKLHRAGVYVIARMVCFSDPQLPRNHPERAVMDGRPGRQGQIWAAWGRRNPWLDGYNTRNHDLIVEMAKEAEALGIDEVQFDYFRFPVDEATRYAVFPAQVDTPRRDVLLGLLRRVDEALRIPIGVDVFGLTAFRKGDPTGLGQSLEDWARHVEVFSPMLYVNGMGAWMRVDGGQRALKLVATGVKHLRRRLGHGPVIRPFLQAFPQGADHYDADFISQQIRGARVGGADGFLFWHPASNYSTVRAGMLGPARGQTPFPIAERAWWRRQSWGDRMSSPSRAQHFKGGAPGSYLR